MNITKADEFALWLCEIAGKAWAAWDADDEGFDQDALGLVEWALLLQTGEIWKQDKLRQQMSDQLHLLVDRLNGTGDYADED